MEDQQSGPGDMTGATSVDDDISGAATVSADADGVDAAEEEPGAAGPSKPRSGRRLAVAVGISAALFVGSAVFAGAAVQPYLMDRALVATKLQVAQTAANAVTTLWNYTPENMDTLVDRASVYLSGDLEADYRKFIDAIAETNKQAKVTDTTEITGAAVESLGDSEATVIVYTNTSATSELTKSIPSLKYLSYRMFLKRDGSRWVVTKMPTITSLNLTPQL